MNCSRCGKPVSIHVTGQDGSDFWVVIIVSGEEHTVSCDGRLVHEGAVIKGDEG